MRILYYLIFLTGLLWLGGLVYFIVNLSQMASPSLEKTDGIVVLTGGQSRLQEAGQLLEQGLAGRLFVSGVNARVTRAELAAALALSETHMTCCVESGVQAQNTAGNAAEVTQWVRTRGLASIRLVTSLEHMPRAMTEMRRVMPDIVLVPHPVGQWRPENIRFMSLAREYSKFLVSRLRKLWLDLGLPAL